MQTVSLSNLLCPENDDEDDLVEADHEEPLIDSTIYCNATSIFTVSDCGDDEYFEILLQREISSGFVTMNDNTRNSYRNNAVNYILKMRAALGFQFQTAYLSLSYFDLFLSKRIIEEEKAWAIQLLSVACLTLAAKLEEYSVPSLSEFQVDEYKFENKLIQRMELLVLDTLEWKMGLVTPFDYFPCFINKFCDGDPPKGTASRIIKLVFTFLREINLITHHPYAIAFASIMVALDQKLSRNAMEMKINTLPSSKFLDMEHISTCYNIMKQLEKKKIKVPNLSNSGDLSLFEIFQSSQATSSLSNKRKRLSFEDIGDQNDDLCEKHQRH